MNWFPRAGVDALGVGQFGFETISAFDVPGGEDELIEQSYFDDVGGVKLVDEGIAERFELAVFEFVEQDGVLGEEAVFGGVGG